MNIVDTIQQELRHYGIDLGFHNRNGYADVGTVVNALANEAKRIRETVATTTIPSKIDSWRETLANPQSPLPKIAPEILDIVLRISSVCVSHDGDHTSKWIALGTILTAKNLSYGDSVLNPIRLMTGNMSLVDMILVRMDDKLSRICRGDPAYIPQENVRDAIFDFLGYLVLLCIHDERAKGNKAWGH